MKILVVGGTGIIGREIVDLLSKDHEVIAIGRNGGDYQVNIEDMSSIDKMFEDLKDVDGIISAAGDANLVPLAQLTEKDLDLAINSKLKGQINLIRAALNHVKENGFITVTTGMAVFSPFPGSSAITMACAGLEGFVKVVELEKERNIRINVVRPALVTESAELFGLSMPNTVSASDTAKVYKIVTESEASGQMIFVPECLNSIEEK
ncbi:short chain dehydrogenase [Carboxylicivirga sp. RSCT41]|uniref:short chain dehydrogenase n=1 Tax=Carboxylicivirga agarovorans TaxID=3417570 RepID=UPI003D34A856